MTEINGWHLPGRDKYFVPICEAALPKQNGFQRDHLLKAFHHVKKWDVAIDVGAYVGFWTLDMAAKFETVFAFEPDAENFECLCKNMVEFPNVVTVNAAVGDKSGQCAMLDDPERMAAGKNVNTGAKFVDPEGTGTIMHTLDELDFPGCDLLKIDVEGFEPMVLSGATKLISKFHPVIIMECDKKFGSRYKWVTKLAARMMAADLGYTEIEYLRRDLRFADGRTRNAIQPDRIFVPNVSKGARGQKPVE